MSGFSQTVECDTAGEPRAGAPLLRLSCLRYAPVVLLAMNAALLAYSATRHSPTLLEPAHLAAGVSHWELGRFELYRVNPPLARMIAAIPVVAAGCQTDWTRFHDSPGARAEFAVGEDFVVANGPRTMDLIVYARWACIPFSLLGGYFAYRWANELYGPGAGLVTLILWCFEPNLLAHAELITPDSACTAFGVVALYLFWKWLQAPDWARASWAGLFLGLAELSKMSWLILFPLWPALCVAWRLLRRRDATAALVTARPGRIQALQLAAMLLAGLYILNLGYGFDGTLTPLKNFTFVSQSLTGNEPAGQPGNRFANTLIGQIPIPLPKQFLLGLDSQRRDFEDYGRPAFLCGEWKRGGWWYYYLAGLLFKVPCGTWLLFAAVIVAKTSRRIRCTPLGDEIVLIAPAIALFALASSQTGINQHLRYVFPSLGLALIFLGQSWFICWPRFGIIAALFLFYATASSLTHFPHHLAYFNDFAGGSGEGPRLLRGSNADWGQDWLLLAEWARADPAARVVAAANRCVVSYPVSSIFPEIEFTLDDADRIHRTPQTVIAESRAPLSPKEPLDITGRVQHVGVFRLWTKTQAGYPVHARLPSDKTPIPMRN